MFWPIAMVKKLFIRIFRSLPGLFMEQISAERETAVAASRPVSAGPGCRRITWLTAGFVSAIAVCAVLYFFFCIPDNEKNLQNNQIAAWINDYILQIEDPAASAPQNITPRPGQSAQVGQAGQAGQTTQSEQQGQMEQASQVPWLKPSDLVILAATIYAAMYAIAWAQYEFAVNSQRQRLGIANAILAAGNAQACAPLLSAASRKQLPKRPMPYSFRQILCMLFIRKELSWYREYNREIQDEIALLLQHFQGWEDADLSEIELPGANLWQAKLQGANLHQADLHNAVLGRANLSGVILNKANLQGANLLEANLQRAHLYGANLQGSILDKANLQDVGLLGADLQYACLQNIYLQGIDLQNVDLQDTDLRDAWLLGANLDAATLQRAYLQRSVLISCNLENTFLHEADVQQAKLIACNLTNADLHSADLRGVQFQLNKNRDGIEDPANAAYFPPWYDPEHDELTAAVTSLSRVKTLYKAKLDPELEEALRREHPHLFELPAEDSSKPPSG